MKYILFVLLVTFCIPAYCQFDGSGNPTISVIHYNDENGLPQNSVLDFTITPSGYTGSFTQGTAGNYALGINNTGKQFFTVTGKGTLTASKTLSTTQPQIVGVARTATNAFQFYKDGGADGTSLAFASTAALVSNRISTGGTDVASANAQIAEQIIYTGTVTAAQGTQINSYLCLKYGITLDQTSAQNYVASNGTTNMWNASTAGTGYNNDIFGIGVDSVSRLEQKVSTSANGDGLFVLSQINDFTSSNASRTSAFTKDISFVTMANNDGAYTFSSAWSAVGYSKLGRQWQMQKTGTVDSVYIGFPKTALTTIAPNTDVYLLTSATSGFGSFSGFNYVPLVLNNSTGYYSVKIAATHLQYLAIATVDKGGASMRHRKTFLFGRIRGYKTAF